MKETILLYSDCPFLAGSENMIVNLLNLEENFPQYSYNLLIPHNDRYLEELNSKLTHSIKEEKIYQLDLIKQPKLKSLNNSFDKAFKILQIPIFFFLKYYGILRNYFILKSFLKNHPYNHIHINNGGFPAAFSCYSLILAAKKEVSITYTVNNLAEGYKSPLRWLDYFIDIHVKQKVNYFITGSTFAGAHLKEVLGSTIRHKTINNGVSKKTYSKSRDLFLQEIGIKSNKIIFSVIANFEKRKGHKYLLDAIKILNNTENTENIHFILEGEGETKENIITSADRMNLKNITILPRIDNIADLYNASDVLILPSIKDEDFPNVIIEAFSHSLPVIGTKIAGIPEQINHKRNGYLVKPKDPIDIVKGIKYFLISENRERCKITAFNYYKERYTEYIAVKKLIKIFKT